MTIAMVVDLMRNAFVTTLWISLPVLSVAFTVGVLISLAQILTSIQDSSFNAVPRLGVFLATLLITLPWMLEKMMSYTRALLGDLGRFAH